MSEGMQRFAVSFPFKGERWAAEVWADSLDEAVEKLRAMGAWGTVDGVIVQSFAAPSCPGWVGRLLAYFRGSTR